MLNQLDTIKNLVADDFEAMSSLISEHLTGEIPLIEQLCHHLIQGGGKRLRPLMLFLASKACHYSGNQHITLAAAVEYFHTASLLHDDVVDSSTLRRGKKTANEIWGNKPSILIGDYLFTQSNQWLINCHNWDILQLFSEMLNQIVHGEIKQLTLTHRTDAKIADYFEIIHSKTALLFSVSAESGAQLAQCSSEVSLALKNYGLHVGNAFQMVDDALDYCSNTETMGKNIGDDLAEGKFTLPLFCALDRATPEQAKFIHDSIEKGSLENLNQILVIIQETKAIELTYELARKEVDSAIALLDVLDDSPYKKGLIELALFAISRTY